MKYKTVYNFLGLKSCLATHYMVKFLNSETPQHFGPAMRPPSLEAPLPGHSCTAPPKPAGLGSTNLSPGCGPGAKTSKSNRGGWCSHDPHDLGLD